MSFVNSGKFLRRKQKCSQDEKSPKNVLEQNVFQIRIRSLNDELLEKFKDLQAEGDKSGCELGQVYAKAIFGQAASWDTNKGRIRLETKE